MSRLVLESKNEAAVPVDKDIIEPKFEDECLKLFLHLQIRFVGLLSRKDVK